MLKSPAPDGSLLPPKHRNVFFKWLQLMQDGGFRQAHLGPRLSQFADGFAALRPSEEDLLAWHAEVKAWVRWRRVPGFWLSALLQNGTIRLSGAPGLYAALSSALTADAQVLFADDLAQSSLETAYGGVLRNRQAFGASFDQVFLSIEGMLGSYHDYLAKWAKSFDYGICNPLADHLYSQLTARWLAGDLAAEQDRPQLDNVHWLRSFIERADREQSVWHRVVARRFLGLNLAATGDDNGRLTQFAAALEIALENQLDTEIGHLHRLAGQTLRDLGQLDEAIVQFQRAVSFEGQALGQEYATYWQALSMRELGDTLLRRAQSKDGSAWLEHGAGQADLTAALKAYQGGRWNFNMHLAIQCPQPLARAVKQQMFRSYSGNALFAACVAQHPHDILAELEESGPREATGLVVATKASISAVGVSIDRDTFCRNRARYFATLNTSPPDRANYLKSVALSHQERRGYLQSYIALASYLARSQSSDAIAQSALELRLPQTIFLLFHVGAESGTLLMLDASSGGVLPIPLNFGEKQVRDWHLAYQLEWNSATDVPTKSQALRRHLGHYEQALAPLLEPILSFFPGRHVKIFPRLHMNAVPFHAMQLNGRPLLQHCQTVSYGLTLGLFLANHGARLRDLSGLRTTRVVVGNDVPLYEKILPSLRQTYGSDLEEHAQVTWSVLREAMTRRPARDTLFACHGVFDAALGAGSALDLRSSGADRQVSFAQVFEQLDLPGCRSVIMGSCDSGVARAEIGAEYMGLPAAMLASGVRYVVGALWTIPALSTAIVIERLMLALRDETASVAEALSELQRQLLALGLEQVLSWVAEKFANDPRLPTILDGIRARGERPFADPYYWAGLQVVGDI